VIGFGTTALLLVLLLALRALTGTDHVDGREPGADGRGIAVAEDNE
jgi:multicomponent K+:H+ antiporter subunit C